MRTEPSSEPAKASWDWPRVVLLMSTTGAAAIAGLALISLIGGWGYAQGHFLALFMACFAFVKFSVASRAIRDVHAAIKSGDENDDPRELHGTASRFWLWVGMKYFAASLALGAAVIILVHGPGFIR